MRSLILAGSLLLIPVALQDQDQDPEPAKPAAAEPSIPEVGQPAPKFRLNDHTGAAVAAGGPANNWTVLAFYPKAATRG